MGYWIDLQLHNISVKRRHQTHIRRAIEGSLDPVKDLAGKLTAVEKSKLKVFVNSLTLVAGSELLFDATKDSVHPSYEPYDDDSTLGASGKWSYGEIYADWLKQFVKGGTMLFISQEGDGAVWGFEFDGKGKRRLLAIKPASVYE